MRQADLQAYRQAQARAASGRQLAGVPAGLFAGIDAASVRGIRAADAAEAHREAERRRELRMAMAAAERAMIAKQARIKYI